MSGKTFGMFAVFVALMAVLSAFGSATPVLNSVGSKSVNEGSRLEFNISTSNLNINSTVFSNITSPVMRGAVLTKLNESMARFVWAPGFSDAGTYTSNFTVNDTGATTTSSAGESVTITVNDVPAALSATQLDLGGRLQQRSNPRSDTDTEFNVLVTGSFTVTNTGLDPITNLNVTSMVPASGFTRDAINLTVVSISPSSINASQAATITVSARIPENFNAVNTNLEEVSFHVSTLTVTGNTGSGTISTTTPVRMQAENNIRIRDVRVTVDDKSEGVSEDDRVQNVRPGATITVEAKVENRFGSNDNVDLQDVELRVTSDDIDIDEEDTLGDIGPRKTKSGIVKFTIDSDEDEDTVHVRIEAEAEDENNARHADVLTFRLEIEREENEIKITSIDVVPETVACEGRADVSFRVTNTGQNDEDKVFIRLASPELQYGQVIGPLELDEDASRLQTASVPVPSNTSAGTKRVTIETYYDGDQLSQRDVALVRVVSCGQPAPQQPGSQQTPTAPPKQPAPPDVEVVNVQQQTPVVAQPPAKVEPKFSDSAYYVPVLILANLVILGVAVLLISKLMK